MKLLLSNDSRGDGIGKKNNNQPSVYASLRYNLAVISNSPIVG